MGDSINFLDGSVASGCILPQSYHTRVKKYMPQKLPSHPQPEVPQGQGFSQWGGQRNSHDSRWQGQGLDRVVFNCLVVIPEILLGDTVARVMKKINTQHPIYSGVLKYSIYLLNIH